ncbi:SURF1 family protein [Paucibacter sp. PLA-PC-4]|uniref:SURF1 family protein n=1 Tax=Paucibacter sp. PLA-PC-4 TaxID=2993655 RepID=UPI002248B4D5|nr:SURF1 family protein [Paucibacter sp. PLA-PC-4]MCX2861212.1 SURF1 family protein [Paucibacter sp. PLA-PC-4]
MTAAGRRWVVLLAAVLAVGLAARLGFWQLDRAAHKRAWQAALDQRGALAPLQAAELAVEPAQAEAQLHRRVLLRGRWLADQTVFLDNRTMNGRVGFYVLTPLQLDNRAEAVLVQRGWVARDERRLAQVPALRSSTDPVELSGRLAASPSRAFELPAPASGAIRQNLSSAAYAQEIGRPLLPLTVIQQADAASAGDGLLRDWPVPQAGLQKHYGYAFQWFALAALFLGLYVWFQLVRPRLRTP